MITIRMASIIIVWSIPGNVLRRCDQGPSEAARKTPDDKYGREDPTHVDAHGRDISRQPLLHGRSYRFWSCWSKAREPRQPVAQNQKKEIVTGNGMPSTKRNPEESRELTANDNQTPKRASPDHEKGA